MALFTYRKTNVCCLKKVNFIDCLQALNSHMPLLSCPLSLSLSIYLWRNSSQTLLCAPNCKGPLLQARSSLPPREKLSQQRLIRQDRLEFVGRPLECKVGSKCRQRAIVESSGLSNQHLVFDSIRELSQLFQIKFTRLQKSLNERLFQIQPQHDQTRILESSTNFLLSPSF